MGKGPGMRQNGMSIREIAEAMEKSPMTVQRLLKLLAVV
jgi:IS30 family transposase